MRTFTRSRLLFSLLGMALWCLPPALHAQCGAGKTFNTYCYNFDETGTVAFEFCPTAGALAQSDINQGIFGGPDNLKVYSGASGSGASGTLVLGPLMGDVSGNTANAVAVDQCLIFVVSGFGVPVGFSCAEGFNGANSELEVCSRSLVASSVNLILSDDEFCSDEGNQTLTGGTPSGGVYSGTGVIDDGNGSSFTFNPAVAGTGTTTVTYTAGGNDATDEITVIGAGTVTMNISTAERCVDEGSIVLPGGGMPTGGTYSGPGVTDQGNGLDFSFNPAFAGVGAATITYTGPAPCFDTATDVINVTDACTCPSGQTSAFYCQGNNESNVIAFEVCPSAGMAVQATITAGSYSAFLSDGDMLNVYSGASGSGTSGTLISGPLSGNLTGTVIMGSVADHCLIFVSTTGPAGSCQDGFETALSVCGEDITPSISFQDPGDFCISDGVQTGLGGGLPTGGVYKGAGVTDDGNGLTFSFDPANAGVGVHTLTYTNGDSAKVDIEVFNLGAVTFTALADICIDAGVQTNLTGGSPAGGTYSGPGVTDNGDGTYDFNPAFAGLGVHTISYTDATGCMETTTDDVEVLAACGCPAGQQSFFHCQANNESNLILFEICPAVAGQAVEATITQGTYSTLVPDGDVLTVYSGASGSGTGGTIVFGPQGGDFASTMISSLGENECLTFVSTTGPVGSCVDEFETPLQICAVDIPPPTRFTASPEEFCLNAGVQSGLGGGTPTGGVYSGPGVTDDGNGTTYTFDPAVAGAGLHTLTYEAFGDPATDEIEVLALPVVSLTAPADLCIDAGVQTDLGGGTPTGGIYDGPGVTDDGNGTTYDFDPAVAGVGTHTLTYTYTDANGCTNSASDDIEVFALPTVTFTAPADLCIDAGVQTDLGGGTPTGGIYDGPGVTDDGNGTTYDFDPAVAGVGTHTLTYTYTDANGCTNSASDDIEVFALPTVTFTPPFENICLNAGLQIELGGGLPTGGIYSGAGVTDDGNGMTYSFDPAVATLGSHSITYTFTNVNGCEDAASATVQVNEDLLSPDILGMLPTLTEEGCTASDVPAAYTTVAELENAGLTVSDDCTPDVDLVVSFSDSPAGFNPIVVTRTYTITDETDKSSQVSQIINIDDTTPPSALCQNTTVQLDASGNGSITTTDIDNGSADNCGDVSLSLDNTSFNCSNVGANTVTLTVSDESENENTCTATVTVEDNVAPVALCQNITIQLDNDGGESISGSDVDNGSNDACGIADHSVAPNTFGCDHIGDNTVTLTVIDNNNNTNTCTATVTVEDDTPPAITQCVGNTAVFNGEEEIPAASVIDFTAEDACGIASTTYSPEFITCDDLGGTVDVLITVTDNNGNENTCTATVSTDGLPCGFMDFGDNGIGCEGGNDDSYDVPTETFTVSSDGCHSNNFAQDDAAYVKTELCGDGEFIAHITSISPIGQAWAGITMRETEDPGSKKVELQLNLGNIMRRAIRTVTNGVAYPAQLSRPGASWLKIVRTGNQFVGYASNNGVNWQVVLATNIPMNSCIQVGMIVTNYNGNNLVTATFDNVAVIPVNAQLPDVDTQQNATVLVHDFFLFPNPAKDQLYLDLISYYGLEVQVDILNQLGQPVLHRSVDRIGAHPENFDLSGLSNGTYFVRVATPTEQQVKKFLIVK